MPTNPNNWFISIMEELLILDNETQIDAKNFIIGVGIICFVPRIKCQ